MMTRKLRYVFSSCLLLIAFTITAVADAADTTGGSQSWAQRPLRQLPVFFRTDGFTQYYAATYPLTKEKLEHELVDPLAAGGVTGILWGVNAGSRVTFASKTGQLLGEGVTASQWKRMRKGDLNAYRNLKYMLDHGNDPLAVAAARAHHDGIKLYAYVHVNKEYGPIGSWTWMLLTDDFSKKHANYRIPGSLLLDFSHPEVRARKLAILRDAAATGVDGLALNLMTRFFENPDTGRPLLTQFIRDVRTMLDEVSRQQGRRLELLVRVPFQDAYERGIDWKTYMKEGLIDALSAYKGWPASDYFDVPMDQFVAYKEKINSACKVHGFIWQALGLVDTDPSPTGKKRYSKPKVKGMYYAQALIHNRVGCDGIELGFASPYQWQPFYGTLGTPDEIRHADKCYMVDIRPYLPLVFHGHSSDKTNRHVVRLRIADDVAGAEQDHFQVTAAVVIYCRPLEDGETLRLRVNGHGPLTITSQSLRQQNQGTPVTTGAIARNRARNTRTEHTTSFLNSPNWWRRGRKRIGVPAEWFVLGKNELEFEYAFKTVPKNKVLEILWVEVTLQYARRAVP